MADTGVWSRTNGGLGWRTALPAALLAALALAPGAPGPAAAQAQADAPTDSEEEGRYGTPADSAATEAALRQLRVDSLALPEDEPFVYPLDGRRSPFRPSAASGGSGLAFSSLALSGIIHAPGTGSVVVLSHTTTGRRYRLRVGDRVGDARLVEVGPRRAVFEVRAYGTTRRAVLRLRESRGG